MFVFEPPLFIEWVKYDMRKCTQMYEGSFVIHDSISEVLPDLKLKSKFI